jgi:hypothetical protein
LEQYLKNTIYRGEDIDMYQTAPIREPLVLRSVQTIDCFIIKYLVLMIGGYQGTQESDNDPNNTTVSQYSFLCSFISNVRHFYAEIH